MAGPMPAVLAGLELRVTDLALSVTHAMFIEMLLDLLKQLAFFLLNILQMRTRATSVDEPSADASRSQQDAAHAQLGSTRAALASSMGKTAIA